MAQQQISDNAQFEINEAVYVIQPQHEQNRLEGIVQFFGQADFASGKWVGVRLTGNSRGAGNTDGEVSGKRYFSCDDNCAVFVRPDQVTKRKLSRLEEIRLRREAILTPIKRYQSMSCGNLTDPSVNRSLSKIKEMRARREALSQQRLQFGSPSSVKSDSASRTLGSASSDCSARITPTESPHQSNNAHSIPPRYSPRVLYQSKQKIGVNEVQVVEVIEPQTSPQEDEQELQKLRKRVIELESSMTTSSKNLYETAKELKNKEDETTILRQSLSDAQHIVSSSKAAVAEHEKNLHKEQRKNETMRNRLIELEDNVEIIYNKFDETSKILQSKEEEAKILKQSLLYAQKNAIGNKSEVTEEEGNLQEGHQNKEIPRKRIVELENGMATISKKLYETTKELKSKEEEAKVLRQSLLHAQKDALGNKSEITKEGQNLQEDKQKAESLQKRIIELENDMATTSKKLYMTTKELRSKEEEAKLLKRSLSDAQEDALGNKPEITEEGGKLQEEEQKNKTARNQIIELENDMATLSKKLYETTKELKNMEEQSMILKQSLSDALCNAVDNNVDVIEQQNNLPDKQQENETLRNQVNKLEDDIIITTKKLDETSKKLQNKEEETARLRQTLSEAQHSVFDFKLRAAKLEQEVKKVKAETGTGTGAGTYGIPFKKELKERIFVRMEHELETSRDVLETERIFKSTETQELDYVKQSLFDMEQEVKASLGCSLPSSPSAFDNESDVKTHFEALQAQVTMLQINFIELRNENDQKTKEVETLQKSLSQAKEGAVENGRKVEQSELFAMEALLKIKEEEIKIQRQELDSLKESLQEEKDRASRFEAQAKQLQTQDNKIDHGNEDVSINQSIKPRDLEADNQEIARLRECLSRVEQDAHYFKEKFEQLSLANEKEGKTKEEAERVPQDLEQEGVKIVVKETKEADEVKYVLKELEQEGVKNSLNRTKEETAKENIPATSEHLKHVLEDMDMFFDEPEKEQTPQMPDTEALGQPQRNHPESQETPRNEGRDNDVLQAEHTRLDFNPFGIANPANKEITNIDAETSITTEKEKIENPANKEITNIDAETSITTEKEKIDTKHGVQQSKETARSFEEGEHTKQGKSKKGFWKRFKRKGHKDKSNMTKSNSSKTNKVNFNSILCTNHESETMVEF